jgi:hypothetical protein
MSTHRTRFSEQTIEIVAVHPHDAPSYVRVEVFHDDDVERHRETDVVLSADQARELAAGLIRHAEIIERARPVDDGCPVCHAAGDDPCTSPLGYVLPGPHTTRPEVV